LLEAGAPGLTPLVCVHGAFAGAWMWEPVIEVLASSGRTVTALSLRGHGASGGTQLLAKATLADYAADVRRVVATFTEPPILVAHSLGALLVQHLIGQLPMRALVMLAPLPPEGMLLTTSRLLVVRPRLWSVMIGVSGNGADFDPRPLAELVFSPRFSSAEVQRHLARMVLEPSSVLIDAHVPRPTLPAQLFAIPTLVLAADEDRVVPLDVTLRTAIYHGGRHVIARGYAHLMQLEGGDDQICHTILEWLGANNL
jgi:pimeloyl-ACP methyl ester carboxylesterase